MITGLCISKAQYLTFFCPKYIFCLLVEGGVGWGGGTELEWQRYIFVIFGFNFT